MFERVDKFSGRKKYIDNVKATAAVAKNIIIVTPKKKIGKSKEAYHGAAGG